MWASNVTIDKLLLNSINMITLSYNHGWCCGNWWGRSSSFGIEAIVNILVYCSYGDVIIMNKIQPSQLAEEQRNATKLFRQLYSQIQTTLALYDPTELDVKDAMDKVLALDKAYPLPLLGKMIEKFPAKFEPTFWWPKSQDFQRKSKRPGKNGWSEELEVEMREIIEVIKRKDTEDYMRLGNLALKINKILAISGPLLTGIAAAGSAFVGNGSWAAIVAVAAEESIESSLEETDIDRREDGEMFELKVALQLGRSMSELRDLAQKSTYSRIEGTTIDEFASKLF
ncbi:hypothetical protein GH714_037541 [Hevea brasiliensis]|uniref:F-box protein n=1 Tax=Hevea brasiliensis TaxID=3981 RepID=A0A6A6LWG0_HEVBR|nr:hypothetical protein GH714_037541 [Hevea brasiliensis]